MWRRRLCIFGLLSVDAVCGTGIFGDRPKLLLLGDSITEDSLVLEGWGSRLADLYTRRMDLIVRGFGGATTRHLRHLAAQYLAGRVAPEADEVKLVVICIGANDAVAPSAPGHVPLVEFARNLAFLILALRESLRNSQIILVTPPMVDPEALLEHPALHRDGRTTERTQEYASAVLQVAKDFAVPVADLCGSMASYVGWRDLLSDGLHLSNLGNMFLFSSIFQVIENFEPLRGLRHGAMPTHYPTDAALLDWALNASAPGAADCAWPGAPAAGWFC